MSERERATNRKREGGGDGEHDVVYLSERYLDTDQFVDSITSNLQAGMKRGARRGYDLVYLPERYMDTEKLVVPTTSNLHYTCGSFLAYGLTIGEGCAAYNPHVRTIMSAHCCFRKFTCVIAPIAFLSFSPYDVRLVLYNVEVVLNATVPIAFVTEKLTFLFVA